MAFDEIDLLKSNGMMGEEPAPAGGAQDPPGGSGGDPLASDPTAEPGSSPQAPAPKQISEAEIAKKYFGVEDFGVVSQDFKTLKERNALYENLVKEKANPFADDSVRNFNSFVKNTGVKDYGVFSKLSGFDEKTTSPLDAMVLAKIMKDPERMAPLESQIRARILSQYGVESEEELSQDQIKASSLAIDSVDSINDIRKFKETAFTAKEAEGFDPEKFFQEKETETQQRKEAWKPYIDKIFESKKFTLPKVAETAPAMVLELEDAQIEALRATAESIALASGQPNEESLKNVFGTLYASAVGWNIEKVLRSYHESVVAMTQEDRDKFFSNIQPAGSRNSAKPDPGQQTQDPDIFAIEGFRR